MFSPFIDRLLPLTSLPSIRYHWLISIELINQLINELMKIYQLIIMNFVVWLHKHVMIYEHMTQLRYWVEVDQSRFSTDVQKLSTDVEIIFHG